MLIEAVSKNLWFILPAYIAAFLPWAALYAADFTGPKWRTVSDTRVAGLWNVFFSVVPACYIVVYIVVQGTASEYAQMSAALVALVFSVLHLVRTVWGLWQLRYFRRWVSKSIDALDAMGVTYSLKSKPDAQTSEEIAENVLVNEKIIDSQLMHGQVRCYLKYSDSSLPPHHHATHPIVRHLHLFYQCIRFLLFWPFHQLAAVFGRRTHDKLEQVPFQPVNVWLNWSVAFASQGLGSWIKEFSVVEDPKNQPGYDEMTARERFDRRAQHFSSQVLGSAWLQLWPELSDAPRSASPLHWDIWDEKSNMADGRLVKAELFERAVSSGEALPFGAPQDGDIHRVPATSGYHAYRRMLVQAVNDLPVQAEFDSHIEDFNIEKLEWLTILLYLGMVAISMRGRTVLQDRSNAMKPESSTTAGTLTEKMNPDDGRNSGSPTAATTGTEETVPDDTDVANSQALASVDS